MTGRVGGTRGEYIRSILGEKYGLEGHRGDSVSTVGPSRDPDRWLRLHTHGFLHTGWNIRINGGATEEGTIVSVHVNCGERGGERGPVFVPAALLFLALVDDVSRESIFRVYNSIDRGRAKAVYLFRSTFSLVLSHFY